MKSVKLKSYRESFTDADFRPLRKLLPLKIPLSMIIDPTNICNFRCKFCPTGDNELLKKICRPKGVMDFDLFCKIIDDLFGVVKYVGLKLKRIHLMKDGEPLLNKSFCDMVSYIKHKQVAEYIATSSNGSLLTEKKSVDLIESGLDVMRISVEHVTKEGYKELALTNITYEQIKRNVTFLYEEKERRQSPLKVFVKIIDVDLSPVQKDIFKNDFQYICDSLDIEKLHGWSKWEGKDFALGISDETAWDGRTKLVDRKVCPEPFTKLAVNFNGEVSVCCADWTMGTIVGDLRSQSIMEIWEGKELRKFRLLLLNGCRDKISACASCEFVRGFPEYTMLDNDLDRLLKVYGDSAPNAVKNIVSE